MNGHQSKNILLSEEKDKELKIDEEPA